jgi:hypothetical protein
MIERRERTGDFGPWRVSYVISARGTFCVPEKILVCDGASIPFGTGLKVGACLGSTGMSSTGLLHRDVGTAFGSGLLFEFPCGLLYCILETLIVRCRHSCVWGGGKGRCFFWH